MSLTSNETSDDDVCRVSDEVDADDGVRHLRHHQTLAGAEEGKKTNKQQNTITSCLGVYMLQLPVCRG